MKVLVGVGKPGEWYSVPPDGSRRSCRGAVRVFGPLAKYLGCRHNGRLDKCELLGTGCHLESVSAFRALASNTRQ